MTVRNSSCRKVMFSQACVKNSVHGGACVVKGGMYGRKHARWGTACMAEAMHVGGHAWQGGGMCGKGVCMAGAHVARGVCVAWDMYGRGACVAGEMECILVFLLYS